MGTRVTSSETSSASVRVGFYGTTLIWQLNVLVSKVLAVTSNRHAVSDIRIYTVAAMLITYIYICFF